MTAVYVLIAWLSLGTVLAVAIGRIIRAGGR